MIWKRTYKFFGKPFTFSISGLPDLITPIEYWGSQLLHFGIHFGLALANPMFSLGGAVALEVRDGEQGHLDDLKEGFNIFPDFVFRVAGVVAGHLLRNFVIGVYYG